MKADNNTIDIKKIKNYISNQGLKLKNIFLDTRKIIESGANPADVLKAAEDILGEKYHDSYSYWTYQAYPYLRINNYGHLSGYANYPSESVYPGVEVIKLDKYLKLNTEKPKFDFEEEMI